MGYNLDSDTIYKIKNQMGIYYISTRFNDEFIKEGGTIYTTKEEAEQVRLRMENTNPELGELVIQEFTLIKKPFEGGFFYTDPGEYI